MTLLNAIIFPFQAGYENIITASGKPRTLFVTKRAFENNHYQYELQSDNSLFSWQGRVSMFAKGVALCLPFIGHITSIALRCFSSSIFPEMPLDFATKCSPEQQLDIAKYFYTHKPKSVDQPTRLELAKILANDNTKVGLVILVSNISYLDLTTDVEFSLKIIQEKLLETNKTVLEQNINNPQFAKQVLGLLDQCPPEQQLAIAQQFYRNKPESVNQDTRLELAKILADDKEGLDLLATHISYLDLTTDVEFSLKIIQEKLLETNKTVLEQNINNPQFAKQVLGLLDQCPPEQQLAIAQQFYRNKPESVNQDTRLELAKILADDKEGLDLLATHISYLDLTTDVEFSLKIIQEKLLETNKTVLEQNINNPQFAKQVLGLLDQCPPEQQLAIAQQFYRNKPESVDQDTRLELAKILADDKEGLDLLATHISYLDLTTDVEFSLKIIQEKLLETNKTVLEQNINNPQFAKQVLGLLDQCPPEQQLAIAQQFYRNKPESVDQDTRLELAKILADDKEGLDLLATHISYLDLTTDVEFSLKIIQEKLLETNKTVLEQNINNPQFAKQVLGLLDQCPPEQQLAIAQQFYRNKPESVDQDTRLELAKILTNDKENLDLLATHISYLDPGKDVGFPLRIIQEKPEVLDQIKIEDSQLAKQVLGLLDQCPPEQQLAIAKRFYTDRPEGIDETNRLELAKILANDSTKVGLVILISNISYLDLTTDVEFSLKIIQEKLLETNKTVLEQNINNPQFAEQIFDLLKKCSAIQKIEIARLIYSSENELVLNDRIRMRLTKTFTADALENKSSFIKKILQNDPTDYTFINTRLDSLHLNEDLTKIFVTELILQTKKVELSHQMQTAIIYALKTQTDNDFIQDLLEDANSNIALADILLSSEEDCELVIKNVKYLNLNQNTLFTQKLFMKNPIPEQIKQHFAQQILQQDSKDREFIIQWFASLNFNTTTQEEVIRELLCQMDSFSEQMEMVIAYTIIEKHPRGVCFLLDNIGQFTHTQELANLLLEKSAGKIYIDNNINKFNLSEEQENSLLEKCDITPK